MRSAMIRNLLALLVAAAASGTAWSAPQSSAEDRDHTLQAMRDEMARSKTRLELKFPETDQPARPYYIEYRLLDLDVRTIVAEFGALVSSNTGRNRFMSVEARVGDYKFDSSNFVSDDSFRGFIGSTGSVGIDRDYDSLRQDLWIATDQAFKEAVEAYSRKQAYLNSLARPTNIDDLSKEAPVVLVEPRIEPDWTSRNWEQEARDASAALRAFPEIQSSRVTYYLIYATEYLMTSEGTEIRTSRSLAAIEAGLVTQAGDGMPLDHFYAKYAARPADLPGPDEIKKGLNVSATELMAMRASLPAQDYTGPVLFEARAAGSLLAQVLGPSLNGSRPPVSLMPVYEQIMTSMGGRSDWVGRIGARVLPQSVTLVDDPAAKDFKGQPLLGGYEVDSEGVKEQRVTLVENGVLKNLLMSRRPGPDFDHSNGHARAGFLSDAQPAMSNLLFTSSDTVSKEELRKRFLDKCREEKLPWCLVVREMDNPAIGLLRQDDFSEMIAGLASGAATGDRLPLLVYRVFPEDGREEIVRGARVAGLNVRALRNIAGIGDDPAAFTYMESQAAGFTGTALGAFGSAQGGGIPATVVAPSLLFDELEVRGARGEPKRLPLLPAPELTARN
ncbi:MAG: metallopeptidase TldD-related protein [Candidatus Acidiferrales bacterium]